MKVSNILLTCALILGLGTVSYAQTPTSTSNGFAGDSEAVALHYNGDWSLGTLATESYDFYDFGVTKGNHLYLQGVELMAPTPGFNVYAGGIKYQPDLTNLFSKTNVVASKFGLFTTAALGNGVPSTGGSHITLLVGGGVTYQLTQNLTWQSLDVQYGRFGTTNFAVMSSGLSFIFGGKAK